jgi:hypothetical protein
MAHPWTRIALASLGISALVYFALTELPSFIADNLS